MFLVFLGASLRCFGPPPSCEERFYTLELNGPLVKKYKVERHGRVIEINSSNKVIKIDLFIFSDELYDYLFITVHF